MALFPPSNQPALSLAQAQTQLQQGGALLYPTETLWGLGVDPFNQVAVAHLIALKQRDAAAGIPLIAANRQVVMQHFKVPTALQTLLDNLWPGPLGVALSTNSLLPKAIAGRFDSVVVRCSSHPVACALAASIGGLVTATSANLSGQSNVRERYQLDLRLWAQVAGWVDGELPLGIASTIVQWQGGHLKMIRHGCIDETQLKQAAPGLSIVP